MIRGLLLDAATFVAIVCLIGAIYAWADAIRFVPAP